MTCAECKHCKTLLVPVLPCFDHARNVRGRSVCVAKADEGIVEYLGTDDEYCERYENDDSRGAKD